MTLPTAPTLPSQRFQFVFGMTTLHYPELKVSQGLLCF